MTPATTQPAAMQPAIVDTNVVIAGLLTKQPDSPVVRILEAMLAAKFPFVVSEALLAEYRVVLERPRLRKLHGLTASEQEAILITLAQHAIVLQPVAAAPAPDPGDQHLWGLLAVRHDLRLVTGDKRLLDDPAMQHRTLASAAFVELLDPAPSRVTESLNAVYAATHEPLDPALTAAQLKAIDDEAW